MLLVRAADRVSIVGHSRKASWAEGQTKIKWTCQPVGQGFVTLCLHHVFSSGELTQRYVNMVWREGLKAGLSFLLSVCVTQTKGTLKHTHLCDRTEMSTVWRLERMRSGSRKPGLAGWYLRASDNMTWNGIYSIAVRWVTLVTRLRKDGLMGEARASPKYTFLSTLLIHLEFVLRHLQQASSSLMSEVFKPNFY